MKVDSFITSDQALKSTGVELARLQQEDDPLFAPWEKAKLGRPTIVQTVFGQRSYWLVPVELRNKTIGFIRMAKSLPWALSTRSPPALIIVHPL